jgi:hypothetical protein
METPTTLFPMPDIAASNLRHDLAYGDPRDFNQQRIPSGWSEARLMRRKPLTDRKIAKYEALGYYSPEYRQARKDLIERKADKREARRKAREGNFDIAGDGRLIYRPI